MGMGEITMHMNMKWDNMGMDEMGIGMKRNGIVIGIKTSIEIEKDKLCVFQIGTAFFDQKIKISGMNTLTFFSS